MLPGTPRAHGLACVPSSQTAPGAFANPSRLTIAVYLNTIHLYRFLRSVRAVAGGGTVRYILAQLVDSGELSALSPEELQEMLAELDDETILADNEEETTDLGS